MARRTGADPKKMIIKLKRLDTIMPAIAGQIAVNSFKDNFRRQGWLDRRLEKWKKRAGDTDAGRAILVLSAKLKRSIRVLRKGRGAVITGTEVVYAEAHNEGANIKGRFRIRKHRRRTRRGGTTTVMEHSRNVDTTIPQRQFLGESQAVIKKIDSRFIRKLKQILG